MNPQMRIKHVELHNNTDEEPWPDLFFVVSGTACIEGLIDFQGVLSVNENYLF